MGRSIGMRKAQEFGDQRDLRPPFRECCVCEWKLIVRRELSKRGCFFILFLLQILYDFGLLEVDILNSISRLFYISSCFTRDVSITQCGDKNRDVARALAKNGEPEHFNGRNDDAEAVARTKAPLLHRVATTSRPEMVVIRTSSRGTRCFPVVARYSLARRSIYPH